MDEPPQGSNGPPVSARLGPGYWIALWLPIVLFIGAMIAVAGDGGAAVGLFGAAGITALITPFICANAVARIRGRGGVQTFFGVLMLYIAIAFAGCSVVLQRL
jgi:hypothetical protein